MQLFMNKFDSLISTRMYIMVNSTIGNMLCNIVVIILAKDYNFHLLFIRLCGKWWSLRQSEWSLKLFVGQKIKNYNWKVMYSDNCRQLPQAVMVFNVTICFVYIYMQSNTPYNITSTTAATDLFKCNL